MCYKTGPGHRESRKHLNSFCEAGIVLILTYQRKLEVNIICDYISKILHKILANKTQKNIKDMKPNGHGMVSFRNSKTV